MSALLPLGEVVEGRWWQVTRCDPRARALVDGESFGGAPHYSRQTPGAGEFMSNGRTLVLLTLDGRAVWGAIENRDPRGGLHWRVSMFRNEGAGLSSELIREATELTFAYWSRRYGALPLVPLRTEVDASRVRPKRDPGRCFLRAGWVVVERGNSNRHPAAVVLEAPGEAERIGTKEAMR